MLSRRYILIHARKSILLYCSGLAGLLEKEAEFQVDIIEEGSRELADISRRYRAELDIYFADSPVTGPHFRTPGKRAGNAKSLLIVGAEEKLTLSQLARLNVDGVISTSVTYTELLATINTVVIRNLKYISPLLIGSLTEQPGHNPFSSLSPKELGVALSLTHGKRSIEIASELNLSPKTVYTYKSRIYKKLGVTNNVQLLKLSLKKQEERMA